MLLRVYFNRSESKLLTAALTTLYRIIIDSNIQIIGPFLMLAVAWMCLPDKPLYRNGVIMVGLARCIAMVLIWNQLAQGDPEYCAILVSMNSVLQIILYAPLAIFFLVVISNQYQGGGFNLSFLDVFESVLLFLGVPLVAALLTRVAIIQTAGRDWMEANFNPVISPVALIALLWTIFAIFCIQGRNIVDNIGDVIRVAVPMLVYFIMMFFGSLFLCKKLGFGYEKSVTQAFTASSNNFELAIAVSAATFGVNSPEALAATIGPLVEVPALLALVYVALWLQPRLSWDSIPVPEKDDGKNIDGITAIV
jgi:arsenite transporter